MFDFHCFLSDPFCANIDCFYLSTQKELFPVNYGDEFYAKLFGPNVLAVLATHQGQLVGVGTLKLKTDKKYCNLVPCTFRHVILPVIGPSAHRQVWQRQGYLITFGVKAEYRRRGIASKILEVGLLPPAGLFLFTPLGVGCLSLLPPDTITAA